MESPLCPPPDPGFRLIETFRWEPGKGILRGDRHLARLSRSAERLEIAPRGIKAALAGLDGDQPLRVRLTVDRTGICQVTSAPFAVLPAGTVWTVKVAPTRLVSDDPWLGLKTTRRGIYDQARKTLPAGVDEMLFVNERGELCEGTITNLFVSVGQKMRTPPTFCGLLPGILREEMLAKGDVTETVMTLDMLKSAERIYVGNSLRGMIPARLADAANIRSRPTAP